MQAGFHPLLVVLQNCLGTLLDFGRSLDAPDQPSPGVVTDVLARVILGRLFLEKVQVLGGGQFEWGCREQQHPAALEMIRQLVGLKAIDFVCCHFDGFRCSDSHGSPTSLSSEVCQPVIVTGYGRCRLIQVIFKTGLWKNTQEAAGKNRPALRALKKKAGIGK